jgi:hypothetical protein
MKNLFYLIAVSALPIVASAQLQNLDFENWEKPIPSESQNKPVGWTWTNIAVTSEDFMFYYPPVEEAQSNQYALKLSVWYNYTKDAAIQTAPIDYRPASLKGFYKYEENFIYGETDERLRDTAMVSVYLTKFNAATNSNDTIGMGIWSTGDSLSAYTEFTVNITYLQPGVPDNITVVLDPSLCRRYANRLYSILDNGVTSYFTVDNLSLVGESTAGIQEVQSKNNLDIFPNPAQDFISFEPVNGEVQVFDLAGKVIQSDYGSISSMDVSHLNKGIYFLRITNKEQIFQAKFEKL